MLSSRRQPGVRSLQDDTLLDGEEGHCLDNFTVSAVTLRQKQKQSLKRIFSVTDIIAELENNNKNKV